MSSSPSLGSALAVDVVLAAVVILAAASLANASQFLAIPLLLAWPAGLYLDLRSTGEIYRLSPEDFPRTELNKVLAGMVDRLGFVKGAVAYVLLWEIPVFMFVSLFLLWFVAPYLPLMLGLAPRLGGAAAGLGVIHSTAWRLNKKYLESRKRGGQLPKTAVGDSFTRFCWVT